VEDDHAEILFVLWMIAGLLVWLIVLVAVARWVGLA
jgi:hypothetical protein